MPPAGFEPAIPATERPQTHALDRAATGNNDTMDMRNYEAEDSLAPPNLWS